MTIWLAITTDELELPIAVADTARELGKIVGKTENLICKTVNNYSSGKIKDKKKKCPYVKVRI